VLAAHQLGVICFFRGQANLLRQMLAAGEICAWVNQPDRGRAGMVVYTHIPHYAKCHV
jgi:hypothetical protein